MYEPITVEIDRDYDEGTYRSHSIKFTGRLVQLIEAEYSTMRLYEWVDQGYIVYLVHIDEEKPGRLARHTLYPFTNTHYARAAPKKGYTAEEVSQAYPEFAKEVGRRQTRTRLRPLKSSNEQENN
jgi:hypothetical protein